MKHSEKQPGKTLAESLGIDVPDDAPGGARLPHVLSEGGQRTTARRADAAYIEYEGFSDVDGYRRKES